MIVRAAMVPERKGVLSVTLFCESCLHQWTLDEPSKPDHPDTSEPEK